MSDLKRNGKLRWSPSYLRRQGKITPGQKAALRDHWAAYGLRFRYGEHIDLDAAFGFAGPTVLEVGFGMGENLAAQAVSSPDTRFLGIEVHKPGIGKLLRSVADHELGNVRVMRGDARLILADYLEGPLFDEVWILFPDPWPDESNAHRRFVQPGLIALLETRMKAGGYLKIATDVSVYADSVSQVMNGTTCWNLVTQEKEWRTLTPYESKGLEKGHEVVDFTFQFAP